MTDGHVAALSVVLLTLAGPAPAQDDRYDLQRLDCAVLRLDRETGALALCGTDEAARWRCRTVVDAPNGADRDEIAALEREVARLTAERDALETRLGEIAALAAGEAATVPSTSGLSRPAEDAKRDIDQAVEVTEHAVRRFRDLYRSLTEDDDAAR